MKRYNVLLPELGYFSWSREWSFDTLMEAVLKREEIIEDGYVSTPIIVEVIPPVDAYAMAHRETEAAKIKAAYGQPRA